MPPPEAYRQVLEELAFGGPRRMREWERYVSRWPPAWQDELSTAAAALMERGDLLRGYERGAGECVGVAPPLVKMRNRGDTSCWRVLGHPAAESVLRDLGRLAGPDEAGERLWHPRVDPRGIQDEFARLGIVIEGRD